MGCGKEISRGTSNLLLCLLKVDKIWAKLREIGKGKKKGKKNKKGVHIYGLFGFKICRLKDILA